MRIAVVANTAWYLLNFRLNLMHALKGAGHEVVAVAPSDAYASALAQAVQRYEHVPISGRGVNPLHEWQSVLALRRLFKREKIELVLSYTPKGNLYSALAAIMQGVSFVPNVSGLGSSYIQRSFVTSVVRMLYRATFGRAERVFFQNEDDMQVFLESGLVDASRAERLPGSGVDLTRFTQRALPDRPTDAPVFLMVARLMWDKGVAEFVEAARAVRRTHPQARFQMLGFLDVDNPSAVPRAQVESWVAEGVVEYLGSTDDVRPFLVAADCIVLPSYREGVPRTLLEAAAIGRPIVTTDAPGCRDTVLDGRSGYLCAVADAASLTEALLRFLALPTAQRIAFGSEGRRLAEDRFDERIVIRRYVELADAFARRPRPAD